MSVATKIKLGILAVAVELLVCTWVVAVLICEDRAHDRAGIVIEEMVR